MTVEDLETWEKIHGSIPDGAIVIMYSGSGKSYGNKTEYLGWPAGTEENNSTDTENLHFPGIAPEAAEWLVSHRYLSQ
jgi:kynurenine formamidase